MSWLFTNGIKTDSVKLQWAPLLTSHDPNPPIALEGASSLEVNPTSIASEEAFGNPTLIQSWDAFPSSISSSEAFGNLSVTLFLTPTGIASGEAFGNPQLIAFVAMTGIPSEEAFGNPSVVSSVSITGIPSEESFGTFQLIQDLFASPTGIPSSESFGLLELIQDLTVSPTGIASEEVFGLFAISGGGGPTPIPEVPPRIYSMTVPCGYRSCGTAPDVEIYSIQNSTNESQDSAQCLSRSCQPVDISYNIQTGEIPIAVDSSSCQLRVCETTPDTQIYSLQDALFFNGTPLSFLIQCPTGQTCPPGMFPRVFTYPPGTFNFPQPPPGGTTPIVLQMNGCSSVVMRVLPAGSSTAAINIAAQQIIDEVAEQQANCDAQDLFVPQLSLVLSDLPTWACAGSSFSRIVTGAVPPSFSVPNPSLWVITDFDFVGGSQPSWMSAVQSGGALSLSGTPSTLGPVSFTIQASAPPPGAGDPWAVGQKTYTIEIVGIDTASPLPSAVPNEQYDQVITATGFGSTPTWGFAYGSLPAGLEFNPFFAGSAAITGIPTEEGDFTFAIFVQDGERQCVKEFELSVSSAPSFDWNTALVPFPNSTNISSGSYSVNQTQDYVEFVFNNLTNNGIGTSTIEIVAILPEIFNIYQIRISFNLTVYNPVDALISVSVKNNSFTDIFTTGNPGTGLESYDTTLPIMAAGGFVLGSIGGGYFGLANGSVLNGTVRFENQ